MTRCGVAVQVPRLAVHEVATETVPAGIFDSNSTAEMLLLRIFLTVIVTVAVLPTVAQPSIAAVIVNAVISGGAIGGKTNT